VLARRQAGQQVALAGGVFPMHLGLAADDDVQPVRGGALARHHVAAREGRGHQAFGDLAALASSSAANSSTPPARPAAAPVPGAARPRAAPRLLHQVHRLVGQRDAPAVALQRGQQVDAHGGIGGVVVARVDQPVAQRVAHRAGAEVHRHAVGRRLARDVAISASAMAFGGGFDDLRGPTSSPMLKPIQRRQPVTPRRGCR
jgi:hypothetical protein